MGRRGDRVVVEAITRVQSVDLVADPATTRGLFESTTNAAPPTAAAPIAQPATVDDPKRDDPALVESASRLQAAEISRLQQEVDRLTALEAIRQKGSLARQLLAEFNLPDPEAADPWAQVVAGRRFLESLMAAPDEQAMRCLVEERAQLVRTIAGSDVPRGADKARPQSRDQCLVYAAGELSAKSFVEAIT